MQTIQMKMRYDVHSLDDIEAYTTPGTEQYKVIEERMQGLANGYGLDLLTPPDVDIEEIFTGSTPELPFSVCLTASCATEKSCFTVRDRITRLVRKVTRHA